MSSGPSCAGGAKAVMLKVSTFLEFPFGNLLSVLKEKKVTESNVRSWVDRYRGIKSVVVAYTVAAGAT